VNTEPDFDRTFASWLEEGPTVLPEQTRHVIVTTVGTIDQRRRGFGPPRRFSDMPTYLRWALGTAAVVALILGGTYLLLPASTPSGVGGPGTSPSPSASLSPTPTSRAPRIGTITLYDTSCSSFGIPSDMSADGTSDLVYGFQNLTDTFGNFALYRLNDDRTWAEAEAWAASATAALETGADLPPADFVTPLDAVDVGAGLEGEMPMVTDAGIYGFLCSSNEPPPGDIFAIYLVGPFTFE
jgi:hypothetical protein